MKRTIKFLGILCFGAVALTACKKGTDGPDVPQGKPPITGVEFTMLTGDLKLGFDKSITGSGWDEMYDEIWAVAGDTTYVLNESINFGANRLTFGIAPNELVAGKTGGALYLYRDGFEPLKIGENINFVMPTVAEGWIPDPALRSQLKKADNGAIGKMFKKYDMIDVAAAAAYTQTSDGDFFDISGNTAVSYEGMELFCNFKGTLTSWLCPNLESADLSGMTKLHHCHVNGCPKLKYLKVSPSVEYLSVWDDTSLVELDLSNATNMISLNLLENNKGPYMKMLDLRKEQKIDGNEVKWNGNVYWRADENAVIKISKNYYDYPYQDNKTDPVNRPGGGLALQRAWKEKNATVEVYDDEDMDKLLFTVKPYSEDPTALPEPM